LDFKVGDQLVASIEEGKVVIEEKKNENKDTI
jgi:hypothetical protein